MKHLLSYFFVFSCFFSYAQGISISGYAGDTTNQQIIAYATVALFDAPTQKLVSGALTDQNGYYQIDGIRPGAYYIEASCLGYQKVKIQDISIQMSTLSLSLNIFMSVDIQSIQGVVVQGDKPLIEMHPDRKIVNIDKTTAAAGISIAQALSVLPEISIDGNTVKLKDASFTILVDGKPSGLLPEQLVQLPATLLQNAEVITNPSVRYSSEGLGGIINLNMKKALYGLNGLIQASGGSNLNANAIATLNYRTKKWNTYLNVWDRYYGAGNKGFYEVLNNDSSKVFQDFTEKTKRNRVSTKLGVEYDINENHLLSLYWLFSYKAGQGKSNIKETYTSPIAQREILLERQIRDKVLDNSIGFNYTYQKENISFLSLNVLYNDLNQPNSFDFFENQQLSFSQEINYKGKQGEANLYYSRLLTTFWKDFALRFEGVLAANFNKDDAIYQSNKEKEAPVNYTHNNMGVAVQLRAESANIGLLAGLKVEYHDNLVNNSDSLLSHQQFPKFIWAASFYISPLAGLDLSIDGSSRMSTPTFMEVSPIYIFDENTLTRNIGNPVLKPAFTNSCNFNLNYANKNNKLRISAILGYTNTKNDFNQIYYIENGYNYTSWNNLAKSEKIFLYSSVNYKFTYFMRGGLAFNLKNDIFKPETKDKESYFNYDLKALLNFFTTTGFNCDIIGIYNPKTYFYSFTQDAFFDLRVALSMTIKRITISLSAYNLLNMYPTIHQKGESFTAKNFLNSNTCSIHIGLMYTFGRKIQNRSNLDLNTDRVKMED